MVTATVPGQFSLEVVPNPVRSKAGIRFTLPAPASVGIKVFDITGRVVRHVRNGKYASGQHQVVWDVKDDAGRRLPSGVYFINLETPGKNLRRKLLLLQ